MSEWGDDNNYLTFDWETSGTKKEYALQPWRIPQGRAWGTSLVWLRHDGEKNRFWGGVQDDEDNPHDYERTRELAKTMLTMARDKKLTIVGWNVQFDIQVLLGYDLEELVFDNKYLDGMLLWKHYFVEPEYDANPKNRQSYSLKQFVREFMPHHAGYETEIDFHDRSPEARAALHAYNKKDNIFTYIGARHYWNVLEPQQRRAALAEAKTIPMFARANFQGLIVDTLSSHDLSNKLTRDARRELKSLQHHGVTEEIVRSPAKLAKLLYDQWGLPVLKETRSKITGVTARSTDKETLHELGLEDERAKGVRNYREALNLKTKFADAMVKSTRYNGDFRVHPQAIIFGTYSGRLTYASSQKGTGPGVRAGTTKNILLPIGFALHQMKNDKLFRGQVVAPVGFTVMEFDAAGQEFRWMAIKSGDETMLQLCMPGEDAHSYMGAKIAGRDYHWIMENKEEDKEAKNARKSGKVGNLSLQYRTSARKLRVVARSQYDIPMTEGEAKVIHFTYQKTYTGVPKYWRAQIALTRKIGYVETLGGRRVQVVGDWGGPLSWSMESTSINYPIQGTGADQKYLAMACIAPYLRDIGAYFAWDLHDGIYLFVPNDKVQRAAVDIKYILDNLPYKRAWGFSPPIPLTWDCKTGPSWGGLRDYHPDKGAK